MRIMHVCLSCFYIDGQLYQENQLVRQNVEDGHEVLVVASTETHSNDKQRSLCYLKPSRYVGEDGAVVVRLPYSKYMPHSVMRKLRLYSGFWKQLIKFRPQIILFHGLCSWELLTVARYKRAHPGVKVFADSHEDFYNSARTFLSKKILHQFYYRWIVKKSLPALEKVLCISLDTIDFVKKLYHVPEHLVEFFPLGGKVFDDQEYFFRRAEGRKLCGILGDEIIFLQTGKMGRRKKIIETVNAFCSVVENDNIRLVIAGTLDDEISSEVMPKILLDKRIIYLGWRDSSEIQNLLCAADLYLQPGTQSVTMQMSLCARCPVILDDVLSHQIFVQGNGWLIKSVKDLCDTLAEISNDPGCLASKSLISVEIAKRLLDYRKISNRILE